MIWWLLGPLLLLTGFGAGVMFMSVVVAENGYLRVIIYCAHCGKLMAGFSGRPQMLLHDSIGAVLCKPCAALSEADPS